MDPETLQIGIAAGVALNQVSILSIRRHLKACPVCTKKSSVPLVGLLVCAATIAAVAVGCKITTARATVNGAPVSITDARFLMSTSAKLSVPTTNGTLQLDISSNPAADAIKAAAEGAAAGAARIVRPIP